jgi:hypothetical protein
MVNFGAARVIGDWEASDSTAIVAANNALIISNQVLLTNRSDRGSFDEIVFNTIPYNGSLLQSLNPLNNAILFQLYSDKVLRFIKYVNNGDVFRLSSGYKTDTWEARVSGNVRIRAIHLAETPLGLKGV